jgi:tetratricopeptide (TPR) repeat protein
MPPTSHKVADVVATDLRLRPALALDVLNLRRAARWLIDHHDWTATEDAVVSALRRHRPGPATPTSPRATDASPEAASEPAATGQAPPPLALAPEGGFEVHPSQGVAVHETQTTTDWAPGSWFDSGTWLALAFVATAVAGAGAGAVVSDRVHAVVGSFVDGWRRHKYRRYMQAGEIAFRSDALERAETFFAKAVRFDRSQTEAWRLLSMAKFENGDPDGSLETLRRADGQDALDPASIDLWVTYAFETGETEEAVDAWLRLAAEDPKKALLMYVEEGLQALRDDERVREKVDELEDEVSLPPGLTGSPNGSEDDRAGPEVA